MLEFIKNLLAFFRLYDKDQNSISITTISMYLVLYKIIQAQAVTLTEISAFLIAMTAHQWRAQRTQNGGLTGVKVNDIISIDNSSPNNSDNGQGLNGGVIISKTPSDVAPTNSGTGLAYSDQLAAQVGGGGVGGDGTEGLIGSKETGGHDATYLAQQIKDLTGDLEVLKGQVSNLNLKSLFTKLK